MTVAQVAEMPGSSTERLRQWATFYMSTFGWTLAPAWNAVDGVCQCEEGEECAHPGKHLVAGVDRVQPTGHGRDADLERVTEVWSDSMIEVQEGKWGIAVLTGSESALLVLDLEPSEDIPAGWLHGASSLVQNSPGGGTHWFFQLDVGEAIAAPGDERLPEGGKVLADGAYVMVYPRPGYRWEGGASALRRGRQMLGEVPKGLRHALKRLGVIVDIADVHQDDPWRARPGAGLAGTVMRTYTKTGDVRRMVDHFGHLIRYTPGMGSGWAIWTDQGWKTGDRAITEIGRIVQDDLVARTRAEAIRARDDGRDDDAKKALAWATRAASRGTDYVTRELNKDPRIQVRGPESWDARPEVVGLPVMDGVGRVLNLRTGDVSVGAREMLISRTVSASLGGLRDTEAWQHSKATRKYLADLERVHGGDFMRLLQRAMGMTLFGAGALEEMAEERGSGLSTDVVFVLGGQPRSGKSTAIETLARVMGDYGKAINPNLLFGDRGNPEFVIASIAGFRLLHMSEPPEGARLNVPMLKAISGGDTLTGRAAYGREERTFEPDATVWIATNHHLEHTDEALWDRLKIFKFRADYSGSRGESWIREAMKNDPVEKAAFFWWAVKGAYDLAREGWGDTSIWEREVEREKASQDPLAQFLMEKVKVTGSPTDRVDPNMLAMTFNNWLAIEYQGDQPKMSKHQIRQELEYRIVRYGASIDQHSHTYVGCALIP